MPGTSGEPWENVTMRAWLLNSFEGVEKMVLGEVPDPKPGPGEALVRIRFAALNPADAFLARAMYPANPPLPHVLGRDGVGEVIALGEGVKNVQLGETVGVLRCDVGVATWGTLAEKTAVCAASLAPVAEGWTLEQMAGAPLSFLTAWQALTQWHDPPAPERSGSVLLVTGASGGVGIASILLGKSMGLTVVALSRSAIKGARLKELGADFVFDPSDPGLRKAVLAAISPRKVDLVVDNIAGSLFNEVIGMLGYAGRISVVGRSAGPVPELNTASLFFRRNRIGGVAVSDFSPETAQTAWREIVRRVNEAGKRPVVDRVVPLEDVKQAFTRLNEGPLGKVVVRVAG
jgi:NADPH2:quinone reductase